MKFTFRTKLVLASTLAASAVLATAAPIVNVELFNVNAPNNVATNQAYIANNSPNQRFQLTSLPSISGSSANNPISIFGSAVVAGSIETITTADPSFDNTLYRFTGFLDLGVTDQVFKIVANDGFLLSIAGTTILTSNTQGTQTTTTSIAGMKGQGTPSNSKSCNVTELLESFSVVDKYFWQMKSRLIRISKDNIFNPTSPDQILLLLLVRR